MRARFVKAARPSGPG